MSLAGEEFLVCRRVVINRLCFTSGLRLQVSETVQGTSNKFLVLLDWFGPGFYQMKADNRNVDLLGFHCSFTGSLSARRSASVTRQLMWQHTYKHHLTYVLIVYFQTLWSKLQTFSDATMCYWESRALILGVFEWTHPQESTCANYLTAPWGKVAVAPWRFFYLQAICTLRVEPEVSVNRRRSVAGRWR